MQAKLRVSAPGDAFEQEADRAADEVMGRREGGRSGPVAVRRLQPGVLAQRSCAGCQEHAGHEPLAEEEAERVDELYLQAKGRVDADARAEAGVAGTRVEGQVAALRGGGEPLPGAVRALFEPRFGMDFGGVRVHTGAAAAESARAVNALAYTAGRDIVLASGQYAPETEAGQRLLAHELAHTVQQNGASHGDVLFRQAGEGDEESAGQAPLGPQLPPLFLPGAGLTLFPGPLTAAPSGTRLPLPASLRLTNALSLGTGLAAPSIPSFVVDLSPRLLVAHVLENIDLATWTREGTPPGAEGDPANIARVSLVKPTFTLDPSTGRIAGTATVAVDTGYPLHIRPPNEFGLEFVSAGIGQFSGQLGYGPLHADFTLTFHYERGRLEEALRPAFAPAGGFPGVWRRYQAILRDSVPGVQLDSVSEGLQSLLSSVARGTMQGAEFATRTLDLIRSSIPAGISLEKVERALRRFAEEITHPGFTVTGGVRLGPLPLSRFSLTAPTTVPLARPLLGAPAAFPLTYSAGGVVIAPPGSLFDIAAPALGYTRSSFGEKSGTALTAAVLPTLSPFAISAGEPLARQFPVYAYAEVSHVRRISEGFDLGVRATVQVSTPELFGTPETVTDPIEEFRLMQGDLETFGSGKDKPPVPNFGVTVYGRFW